MSYEDDEMYRLHRSTGMALVRRPELASGIRIDGCFEGPLNQTSSVWKARPPTLEDGTPYPSLVIAASNGPGVPAPAGTTVTVRAMGSGANGGRSFREFHVGYGLTAELMVGYYDSIDVKLVPDANASDPNLVVPSGFKVFFVWSLEVFSNARLTRFVNYPALAVGTTINIPEGADTMTVLNAGTITFQMPQFGTTFARPVLAGETIPVLWGAMSCNVANRFIFKLKSL